MNRGCRARLLALVVVQAGLAGCASCPPIRAAWYRLQPAEGQAETVMLALVNEGSTDIALRHLAVNPGGRQSPEGWSPDPPTTLHAGEVRVYDLMSFKDPNKRESFQRCRLPVALVYTCDASARPAHATIEGKMPNYLPDEWVRDCKP
jgi:hypothetical protein